MELTITFYNVENLYDTVDDPGVKDGDFTPSGALEWTEDRYQQKLDNIAEVLFATGSNGRPPAFIGLCEVENIGVLKDLVRRRGLSDTPFEIVHLDTRDVRGIDVAFLFNRNVFIQEGRRAINFEVLTGQEFGARDILHVWGNLQTEITTRMHFFVNHWPSRHSGEDVSRFKRVAAAEALRSAVDEIFEKEPDSGIVIMGDFNDEPHDETLRSVLSAGEHYHAEKVLINLGWKHKKRNAGTVNHEGDWYMFDSIIVSSNLLLDEPPYIKKRELYIYDEGDTVFREPRSNDGKPNRSYVGKRYKGGYSDHLAVYCRMATHHA